MAAASGSATLLVRPGIFSEKDRLRGRKAVTIYYGSDASLVVILSRQSVAASGGSSTCGRGDVRRPRSRAAALNAAH